MAAKKAPGEPVVARENAAGDVSLGIVRGGAFVPLYTVPGFRVAQLTENATDDNAGDDSNEEGGN